MIKRYHAELVGLIVFFVYLRTLAPSVIQIDSGELAAVQATLGIAHPTGYPLFAVLGYLWLKFPLPFTPIFRLNILAALWCSLGIVFFVKAVRLLLERLDTVSSASGKAGTSRTSAAAKAFGEAQATAAAVSGGLLAFSRTYWFQSTSVEVYSLHLCLVGLALFVLMKACSTPGGMKFWLILAFVLGLGFLNHMTTLLLLPGLAYLFFNREGLRKSTLKKAAAMAASLSAVTAAGYGFLALRAASQPLLNWGNPSRLDRLWRHISGKQYQVWLYSSLEVAKKQFVYFLKMLPAEFTLVGLGLALLGLVFVFRRQRRTGWFILTTFAATVIYAVNYDIADIDSYFLLAYVSLAVASGFGFFMVLASLNRGGKMRKTGFAAALLCVAVVFVFNFKRVDQSRTWTFSDYTRALLDSVDPNGLVVSYQWDFFLSASYYFQRVEKFRRDVAVVDKELLRRSWYYPQIEKSFPGILAGSEPETAGFLTAVSPFEEGRDYDPRGLEQAYRSVLNSMIESNLKRRSVYLGPELVEQELAGGEFQLPDGYTVTPQLFLYKISRIGEYSETPEPDFYLRFPPVANRYTDFIARTTATMLLNRAAYELSFGREEKTALYIRKIAADFPGFPIPPRLKPYLGP